MIAYISGITFQVLTNLITGNSKPTSLLTSGKLFYSILFLVPIHLHHHRLHHRLHHHRRHRRPHLHRREHRLLLQPLVPPHQLAHHQQEPPLPLLLHLLPPQGQAQPRGWRRHPPRAPLRRRPGSRGSCFCCSEERFDFQEASCH